MPKYCEHGILLEEAPRECPACITDHDLIQRETIRQLRATIDRLRAELAEAREPDCRLCMNIMGCQVTAPDAITCRDGSEYFAAAPLRMYEKEGKV